MVRPQGVTAVAVCHLLSGVFLLLGACVVLLVAIPAVIYGEHDAYRVIAPLVALGLGFSLSLGLGVLNLVVGWGLLRMKSWGRWAAIILNASSLVVFPVGTLIGGLILWYLFQPEVIRNFESARSS